MKRIISIIFLSLLVMKIGGYFAFLSVQQYIAQKETKAKILNLLPSSTLTKFCFSNTQFDKINWQESEKEFYFNDKLYDVVRSEIKGSNHILYCLADENESEIYSEIMQMSKTHSEELPLKSNMVSLLNLLNLKYTIPQILNFENKVFSILEKTIFRPYKSILFNIKLPLISPPPEA